MQTRKITNDRLDRFMMFPAWLEDLEVSLHAKFLYMKALGRLHLSIRSGWFDEEGVPFCYYRRAEMAKDLGTSERSVSKYLGELKDAGLLEVSPARGQMPMRIYLSEPVRMEADHDRASSSDGMEQVSEEKEKWGEDSSSLPKVAGRKRQSSGKKTTKWGERGFPQSYIEKYIYINNTKQPRACEEISEAGVQVMDALSRIKPKVTKKDRRDLSELVGTYGEDRVERAMALVEERGTVIRTVEYLRSMLASEEVLLRRSRFDYGHFGAARSLGVQPVESRYLPGEMDAIIARKIEESRREAYA